MNIYVDESGSINNNVKNNIDRNFVIALVHIKDTEKAKKKYKRFVRVNYKRLQELDKDQVDNNGKIVREGGKMFINGKFVELKGCQFDKEMKDKFLDEFNDPNILEVFYINIYNCKISDKFCSNKARAFNYVVRKAIEYFLKKSLLPNVDINLHLDERNERTDLRFFLQDYLNTELCQSGIANGSFVVEYYDSSNCKLVQIADVFSNIYFSNLLTNNYNEKINSLFKSGTIRMIFNYPLQNNC